MTQCRDRQVTATSIDELEDGVEVGCGVEDGKLLIWYRIDSQTVFYGKNGASFDRHLIKKSYIRGPTFLCV